MAVVPSPSWHLRRSTKAQRAGPGSSQARLALGLDVCMGERGRPCVGHPVDEQGLPRREMQEGNSHSVSPSACICCSPHSLLVQQTDLQSVGSGAFTSAQAGPSTCLSCLAGRCRPCVRLNLTAHRVSSCLPPGRSELTPQGLLCRRTLCVHSLAHPSPNPPVASWRVGHAGPLAASTQHVGPGWVRSE